MAKRIARLVPRSAWVIAGLAVAAVIAVAFTSAIGPAQTAPSATPTVTVAPTPSRSSIGPLPSPSQTPERAPTPKKGPEMPAELKPVEPDQVVEGEDGMRVALTKIESVTGEAVQPGEIAGPAVRVTVSVTNGTDAEFNTSALVVNAYVGKDRTPAGSVVAPGGVPFIGRLAPGESTYGVYLFSIAESERSDVTITVDYSTKSAMVVFRGRVG